MKINWRVKFLLKLRIWHTERSLATNRIQGSKEIEILDRLSFWFLIELTCYTLLILAYIWLALGFAWDFSNSEKNWFQRAGAILVLTGLLSEFFVANNNRARAHVADFVKNTGGFNSIRRFFMFFSFFSAILGTFIWAYGDMLF